MNDHARFRELAAGAPDGILTPAEARELDAHLDGCPSCRAEIRRFAQDRAALTSFTPTPVSTRLQRRVERGGQRSPSIRWPLLATAAMIGTLVGAAMLSGAGGRLGEAPPSDDDTPRGEASPVTSQASPAVGALLFRDPGVITLDQRPSSLALADLDGDGDDDMLIGTDATPDRFVILLGDGLGDFAQHSFVELDRVSAFELEDIDDDGFVDILGVAGVDGTVAVLYGTGLARFLDPVRLVAGTGAREAEIVDIDGDGRNDIVTANFGSDDLAVLSQFGPREYMAGPRILAGDGPAVIAAGDFDADGAVDIAVGSRSEPGLSIHWGAGDGSFGSAMPIAGDFDPIDIVMGDIDSDGAADLVVANGDTATISILVARPSRRAWTESVLVAPGQHVGRPRDIEIADMDGDGHLDLIVANGDTDEIQIWVGDGRGFAEPIIVAVGRGPTSVEARDLDDSGRLDLVVTHIDDGTVQVVLASR